VLVLSIIQGPAKGKVFNLPSDEPQLIGRSSEAIPIDDNAISRRHAELTPDDGAWYLRDLQSQNGTWLNGTRIFDRARLKPGDQIRVGQTLLVFGGAPSKAHDAVRVVGKDRVEASIERTMPSVSLNERSWGTPVPRDPNEDSVILAEPEPRLAALDHLRIIYRLTSMLSQRVMDRGQLLEGVIDLVFSEFSPQRGCVMLLDEEGSPITGPITQPSQLKFVPAVVRFKEQPLDADSAQINVSKTILQHTIAKHEGILATNAMNDPRFAKGDSVQRMNIRSAICSPIVFREKTYGAIYIDSSVANYTFTPEQLSLMNAIGQHAGLALANAELYQEKLQSERLAVMGETVATLSHSIKNILQGLRGGADVVEMGLTKEDLKVAKGGWPILKRNLDRIVSLTINMLAFSRQRKVELELSRINPLLEDCVQLVEPQANAKQVAVILDVDAEVPPVPIDPPLVHQAAMNLITNAVQAAPQGTGVVTIRVVYKAAKPGEPAHVDIAVIDNGVGIPQSKQRWVFEPFHTTKGVRGTGLGLAVARRVAQQHGGDIRVESVEGKGATFRLILPVDAAGVADPSETAHHGKQ
jgi:two-component system, NtrC family, sensor kinase